MIFQHLHSTWGSDCRAHVFSLGCGDLLTSLREIMTLGTTRSDVATVGYFERQRARDRRQPLQNGRPSFTIVRHRSSRFRTRSYQACGFRGNTVTVKLSIQLVHSPVLEMNYHRIGCRQSFFVERFDRATIRSAQPMSSFIR